MSDVVLCDTNNVHDTINELKKEWVMNIVEKLNLEEDLNYNDFDLVRQALSFHGIEILTNITNGWIKIYKKHLIETPKGEQFFMPETKKNLIAEWNEPKFVKVIENKEVYYEIHLNEWSIFNIRL